MKHLKLFFACLLIAVLSIGQVWADTYTLGWGTASGSNSTNFTATSGSVSGVVSFTTDKNSSQNAPAYNSNNTDLRLYYNGQGNGGSITLTPASRVTITGFVMTTTTSPSVKYTVDGGTAVAVSASSNTYTVSGISASSSLKIQNVNTSNTQLRIKTIQITYTTSGGGSENPTLSFAPFLPDPIGSIPILSRAILASSYTLYILCIYPVILKSSIFIHFCPIMVFEPFLDHFWPFWTNLPLSLSVS